MIVATLFSLPVRMSLNGMRMRKMKPAVPPGGVPAESHACDAASVIEHATSGGVAIRIQGDLQVQISTITASPSVPIQETFVIDSAGTTKQLVMAKGKYLKITGSLQLSITDPGSDNPALFTLGGTFTFEQITLPPGGSTPAGATAVRIGATGVNLTVLGIGAMMGLDPLVSQALGAGDRGHARRLLWQGAWLAVIVGLVLSAVAALTPGLLVPFGIDPAVAAQASSYLYVRLIGLVPMLLFVGVRSYLQALGITRPMLVVKQNPDVAYDNVLVAVDPSDDAMKVLEFAAHVAPRATLQVFHALDDSLMGRLRSAGVRDDAISAYTAELLGDARTRLDEYVAKLHGRSIFVKVEPGDARVLIPQQAAAMGASLIVMGKQGMSWLAESIVGSVARRVLEQATCDVLVVPQGPAGNSN